MLTQKTARKRGDAIFLEPEVIRSLLDQFWKMTIKMKQLTTFMTVSLKPKNEWLLNVKVVFAVIW